MRNAEFLFTMATRVNKAATAASKKVGRRHPNTEPRPIPLQVVDSITNQKGELAKRYTAEGEGLSPPLSWNCVPIQTSEFAMICEDLDSNLSGDTRASTGPRVHWIVYRIPSGIKVIPEGVPHGEQIFSLLGAPLQGTNSFGVIGYTPPSLSAFDNWHHYRFRIYSLDTALKNLLPGMTKEALLEVIKPHIIETSDLVCRYRRANFKAA